MKSLLNDLISFIYGDAEYSDKQLKVFGIILGVLIIIGLISNFY